MTVTHLPPTTDRRRGSTPAGGSRPTARRRPGPARLDSIRHRDRARRGHRHDVVAVLAVAACAVLAGARSYTVLRTAGLTAPTGNRPRLNEGPR